MKDKVLAGLGLLKKVSPRVALAKARECAERGDYRGAISYLDEGLERHNNFSLLFEKAIYCGAAQKYDEGVSAAESALKHDCGEYTNSVLFLKHYYSGYSAFLKKKHEAAKEQFAIAGDYADNPSNCAALAIQSLNYDIKFKPEFHKKCEEFLGTSKAFFSSNCRLCLDGTIPFDKYVFIYTPPKTGSTSLVSLLEKNNLLFDKIHSLNGTSFVSNKRTASSLAFNSLLIDINDCIKKDDFKKIRVVSSIREPISWFISFVYHHIGILRVEVEYLYGAFTEENCSLYLNVMLERGIANNFSNIIDGFGNSITEYFMSNLAAYLKWYSGEYRNKVGYNIDAEALKRQGFYRYGTIFFYVLEKMSQQGAMELCNFLGIDCMEYPNVRPRPVKNEFYESVKAGVRLDLDVVLSIYSIFSCDKFYTQSEMNALAQRWSDA